jgi:hypothetical protein
MAIDSLYVSESKGLQRVRISLSANCKYPLSAAHHDNFQSCHALLDRLMNVLSARRVATTYVLPLTLIEPSDVANGAADFSCIRHGDAGRFTIEWFRNLRSYSNRVPAAVAQPAPIGLPLTSRTSIADVVVNSSSPGPSSKAPVTFCDPMKTPTAL